MHHYVYYLLFNIFNNNIILYLFIDLFDLGSCFYAWHFLHSKRPYPVLSPEKNLIPQPGLQVTLNLKNITRF